MPSMKSMQSGIHAQQLRRFLGILATRDCAMAEAGPSSRENAAAQIVPIEMNLRTESISYFALIRMIVSIHENSQAR
jgi:hypothetical protein